MARLDYRRKKMLKIYAVALVLVVCCIALCACNNERGIYDVSDKNTSPEVTHFIAKFINILYEGIGDFGWTIVAFTVILKLILSPLDVWQKVIARRNAKAMERMKPQLEALQEKYGEDKQRIQQEQMALYKKEKYSMLGACLPTIVTLVVFFIIFAGFREMVGWKFANDYLNCYQEYDKVMVAELGDDWSGSDFKYVGDNIAEYESANDKAQQAVYDFYFSDEQKDNRGFLWIKNIFVPDSWKTEVPDYLTVTGQSGFATSKMEGLMQDEYNTVMGKCLGEGGWGKEGKWNGFLILPVLSLAVSIISQKLLSKAQGTPPPTGDGKSANQTQASMKMMQYMMPAMVGVFAILYSSAFALYMLVSSLTSTVFQLAFNLGGKIVDNVQAKKA